MASIEDVLDQLVQSATDERDKGDKFERLIANFLRTDLTWAPSSATSGCGQTGRAGRASPTPASTWSPRNATLTR